MATIPGTGRAEVPDRANWPREALGALLALVLALLVVSHLATTPGRASLLFTDGDSLVNVLVVKSVAVRQPQDWAMSPVLFLPELVVYGALSLLGLSVKATLVLNAIINFLALYASMRFVAGSRQRSRAPITGTMLAFGAFCLLALLEGPGDRDSLELASLLATTTYYSATVIGVVLTVGLMRRTLDDDRPHPRLRAITLALIAGVSTFSNPLYLAWALPLVVPLAFVAIRRRAPGRPTIILLGGLAAGALLGIAARIPLGHVIVASSSNYVQPVRWQDSVSYYVGLLSASAQTTGGVLTIVITIVLLVGAVVLTFAGGRRHRPALTFVAAAAWFTPAVVVAGAIVLGTDAARYLQPVVFMSVLTLTVIPDVALAGERKRVRHHDAITVAATGCAVAALALGAAFSIPRLVTTAATVDPSLKCVTDWVSASGQIGAGQYWTVRAPKAYLKDPRQLVQTDDQFNAYAWLVDRDDFTPGAVTFVVTDRESLPYQYPKGISAGSGVNVDCGQYTIIDFGTTRIPLGPERF